MALTVQQMRPMVPLPFLLSVLRRLEGATVIERLSAPPPSPVLSTGRGGDALVLALLNGDQALYQVGQRLEERGMRDLLQPAFTRASLHDYRCGHSLDARFAANLQKVFGASALKALEVDARPTPWLPQDTTTLALDGA